MWLLGPEGKGRIQDFETDAKKKSWRTFEMFSFLGWSSRSVQENISCLGWSCLAGLIRTVGKNSISILAVIVLSLSTQATLRVSMSVPLMFSLRPDLWVSP
jgi:hypothetical protein